MAEIHSEIYLSRRKLLCAGLFVTWAFVTKLFFLQINSFIDTFFEDASGFYFLLALTAVGFICFLPFVAAATAFVESLSLSLKDPRFHNQRSIIFVVFLGFLLLYLQFLFITDFEGYFAALQYNFAHPKLFKLGVIAYISLFYFKRNCSNHISQIVTVCCWFFIAMYLWTLYFSLGLDDGCQIVGGDPLFGGGGYEDCDPHFINQKEIDGQISQNYGFSVKALSATEMLISQMVGIVFASMGYSFGKRKKIKL